MSKIKKFFSDFRSFISKGNILDMAVGVVIGAAFKEIINALVNNLLMPLITSAIPGGLEGFVTVLNPSEALATSASANTISYWGVIYDKDIVNVLNWGTFINAIINFLIIAFIMFIIVKSAMKFNEYKDREKKLADVYTLDEVKALRKEGKSYSQIRKLREEKVAADEKAKAEKEAADKEAAAHADTELSLLKDIKTLLAKQAESDKK